MAIIEAIPHGIGERRAEGEGDALTVIVVKDLHRVGHPAIVALTAQVEVAYPVPARSLHLERVRRASLERSGRRVVQPWHINLLIDSNHAVASDKNRLFKVVFVSPI